MTGPLGQEAVWIAEGGLSEGGSLRWILCDIFKRWKEYKDYPAITKPTRGIQDDP
jgi:hypothetical protein